MIRKLLIVICLGVVASTAFGQSVDKKQMTARVKAEFLHSWNGYKKYCWGHDDLKPISKTCRDWYGQSILMTPVDSLDSCGIYFGTTGGQVYASADGGDNWTAIVRDLPPVLSVEVQTLS